MSFVQTFLNGEQGLLVLAFLSFFLNIVMSVGLKGVLGIFGRSRLDKDKLLPAQK